MALGGLQKARTVLQDKFKVIAMKCKIILKNSDCDLQGLKTLLYGEIHCGYGGHWWSRPQQQITKRVRV